MVISNAGTGDEISAPLLHELVAGTVDYKGRPSVRSNSGCWKSSVFIIGVGVGERICYYGISLNLINYLSGSMGLSTAAAVAFLNAWSGASLLSPILGAFIADSYSGRYPMILLACVLYISGLILLTLSASLNTLNSSECETNANNIPCSPSEVRNWLIYISLYMVALAQGGYLPCVQAFGADQFDEENEKECKAKSSFFNWWTCFSFLGIFAPLLVITYIQENLSWALGFGIPAVVMTCSLILFLVGTPSYRFRIDSDGKNPFMRICSVFVKAMRNWRSVDEEANPGDLLVLTDKFKFLNKALIAPESNVKDVEDAKSILSLLPIWCTSLGYSIVFAQPSTLYTKQANTMDRNLIFNYQIPAASFQQYFIAISIVVFIPLYDRVLVPIARTITKKPSGITMLQRIGIGLFVSLVSIVIAAFVEMKRIATAKEYQLVDKPNEIIPMSAWWLVPQYVLSGTADVFTMIGLQEFFYEQVPQDLKSIGVAMNLSIMGIGSLLSSFIVSFIQNVTTANHDDHPDEGWFPDNLNRAHIDYFYWLLTGFSVLQFTTYIYFARSYVYRRKNSTLYI